jgi:hypothetical protein
MNLNNIFGAFEDDAPLQEKAALLQLQETQAFKLGMFKKIIWNQKSIEKRMEKFMEYMPDLAKMVDMDNDASEFVTHTRAWTHIKEFDPTSEQGIDASHIFSDKYTITACDLAIHFWEEKEEYEKCAHIKKVKDLLQKNVPM